MTNKVVKITTTIVLSSMSASTETASGSQYVCGHQLWHLTLESVTSESSEPSDDITLWETDAALGFGATYEGLYLAEGYLTGIRTDSVDVFLAEIVVEDTDETP